MGTQTPTVKPQRIVPAEVTALPVPVQLKIRQGIVHAFAQAELQHLAPDEVLAVVMAALTERPQGECESMITELAGLATEIKELNNDLRAPELDVKLAAHERLLDCQRRFDGLRRNPDIRSAKRVVRALCTRGMLEPSRVRKGHLTAGDKTLDPCELGLVQAA